VNKALLFRIQSSNINFEDVSFESLECNIMEVINSDNVDLSQMKGSNLQNVTLFRFDDCKWL